MKKKILLIALFISSYTYSQTETGITLGYKKLSNNNMSIGISRFNHRDFPIAGGNIEAKYITDFKNNHIGAIGLNVHIICTSYGLNISNKYIEPNIGFDLLFIRLNVGLTMNFQSANHLSFGTRFQVPLKRGGRYSF